MGMIAWLLASLVVYLESLNGQSSITFAPQAIMTPVMWEDPVIFETFSQILLHRFTYKVISYTDFAPYLQFFRKFEAYLVNFTNDLNSPDIISHFREADTIQLTWDRYKYKSIQIIIIVQKHINADF